MKLTTKCLLTLALFLFVSEIAVGAVTDNTRLCDSKLSISTQMFLDELQGELSFDDALNTRQSLPGWPRLLGPVERPYVAPDTVDGRAYISAFVTVTADEDIDILERMDVIIESRFQSCASRPMKHVRPLM